MSLLDKVLFVDALEEAITCWEPRSRRRAAIKALTACTYLMAINVALYVFGIINEANLILITLILSWLALNVTFVDIVATTDVREEATDD